MNNKMISRRRFIVGSTGAASLMLIPTISFLKGNSGDTSGAYAQRVYIETVLLKHTKKSKKLHQKHVQVFAKRFTDQYGEVDYKTMYSGLAGEYRLTRLFVRSAHLSV
ncbi:hypothetical protein [Zhongshania sp.]|jgi:hypothetical protein|uniref:hypothetical protein n=1 Tax=Zhongshania sp. TaxID=1971902 RepID=UPI0039E5CB81